jgi:UDP-N-acetylmuramoylalanine--D-glutamate ligase
VTEGSTVAEPTKLAWRDRRVLVFGLATSGRAAVELLRRLGARVTGVDENAARLDRTWSREHLETASAAADPALLDGIEWLVLSPGIPLTHPFVRAAAAAGIPVVSEIELGYLCTGAAIAAITGSKGKSTTTALAGALLAAQGKRCEVAGNIGAPFTAIADRLADQDWVVLELSSFQLETVDTFHARAAVHLGVSPDHLDRYPDLEAYAAAKARIVRHQTRDDVVVVHTSEPHAARVTAVTPARVVGFDPDWRGTGVVRRGESIVWRDRGGEETLAAVSDVPLLGAHNVRNAMAALALARALGPVDDAVREALRAFRGLPFRMQPAGTIGGIAFVNDSKATTVDAVAAAVEGLPGSVMLALGGRNKGLDFSPLRAHLERVRRVFTLGESAPEIEAALRGAALFERVRDLDELVARALAHGRAGDTLVFSPGCTSFDMFRNAEHRGEEFDAAVERARARAGREAAT